MILGSSGFLGANWLRFLLDGGHEVIAHANSSVIFGDGKLTAIQQDLEEFGSGYRIVEEFSPDVIINCAALADIEKCEKYPKLAKRLNSDLPKELAQAGMKIGAQLIHVSSDGVFGASVTSRNNLDIPTPMNNYGHTKLEGERLVIDHHPTALVVRTNIVGWSPKGNRSLLEYFYNRLQIGEKAPGFTDVFFRPVGATNLVKVVQHFIESGLERGGVIHLTGEDLVSKWDFGVMVARLFGFDELLVTPSTIDQSDLKVRRGRIMDIQPTLDFDPWIGASGLLSLEYTLGEIFLLKRNEWQRELAKFAVGGE